MKPVGDPKSYRPRSLICVPYNSLEKLIYARVQPTVHPLLPKEQDGFQHGTSTVDQVVLLTKNIENSFETKKKTGAVFVDLTAAYDTVWHHGLSCKLLRLLPDKHMVRMIMELFRNRSFTFTTGDSKQSRLRGLKNDIPQGSVLALLLFKIYKYNLPSTISRKFAFADDLALLHSSGNWKYLEGTLSQDMTTLSAYFQTWRLKLSHIKMVTAAFYLNNREIKRVCPTPTYHGVKLDRSLAFRHHLVALHKKTIFARYTAEATCRIRMGCWCQNTAHSCPIFGLLNSLHNCSSVWCSSAHTHLINSVLNDALRIVTGYVHPTPTDHLLIFSGIQSAEFR